MKSVMPFFKRKNASKPQPQQQQQMSRTSSQSSSTSAEQPNGDFMPAGDLEGSWSSVKSGTSGGGARPKTLVLNNTGEITGDDNDSLKAETPHQTASRLSKTLQEVLHDKDALPCFIQYMGHQRGDATAAHLIKLWLDAESFQAATFTRIRTHSCRTRAKERSASQSSGSGSGGVVSPEDVGRVGVVDNGEVMGTAALLSSHNQALMCNNNQSRTAAVSNICHSGTLPQHYDASSGASTDPCIAGHATVPTTTTTSSHSTTTTSSSTTTTEPSSLPPPSLQLHPHSNQDPDPSGASTSAAPTPCTPRANLHGTPAAGTEAASGSSGVTDSSAFQASIASEPAVDVSTVLNTSMEDTLQEKLRKSIAQDAVNIYQTYISQDAVHSVGVTDDIRNSTISKICREDGQVDPYCFQECQEFVVNKIQKEYFSGFLHSEFHCKHQVDILTGHKVYLADILYNELALCYLFEYMEQEHARCLLQCFLDLDNFQQHLSSLQSGHYDGMEAQADAMVIYDKYFSLQATEPLGFDDTVRFDVESTICREGGPLPDCFAKPKHIVLRTIDKVYFQNFLKSEMYFKYLHDLITTVQTATDLPPQYNRKRRGSDSHSEHSTHSSISSDTVASGSISSKNTLLASGGVSSKSAAGGGNSSGSGGGNSKKVFKINEENMRIDERLFNPDSLWRRDQAGKMSLGKINELGHFVSDFDPEPDHDRKKKGTSFLSKLRGENENQEEMAAQIAKMIIEDINKVTSQTASADELDDDDDES